MKILNVLPKQIHVVLELPIEEVERILDYFDLANPIYVKVMKDSDMETGEYMENDFIAQLRHMYEDVHKGIGG